MRILIVEDEIRIAKLIERRVRQVWGAHLTLLQICLHTEDAEKYLNAHTIDLLFLDLNLNGHNGFDLLHRYSSRNFHLVIISAYTDQALRAFEFGALDFIPKPFTSARLEQTFLRLTERTTTSSTDLKYLAVKKKNSILSIPISDIHYIKAEGHYVMLYLANEKYLCNKTLDMLEMILPEDFQRIHRSYIVKLDMIAKIERFSGSKYQVIMQDGLSLPLSRQRYKSLRQRII